MGTSASNKGPASGISLDPPWLPQDQQDNPAGPLIAPPARFRSARRELTEYLRTGDTHSLKRALGLYSHTGMGGAAKLSQRMQRTSKTAGGIFSFFQAIQNPTDASLREWVEALQNQNISKENLIDSFVDRVLSIAGSLDEDSCRQAMDKAMVELLKQNEDIDFFHLTENEIWLLLTHFVANEAYNRFSIDLGAKMERMSLSPELIVARQNEMLSYLYAEIQAQLQSARSQNNDYSVERIISAAIKNTFSVYEEE